MTKKFKAFENQEKNFKLQVQGKVKLEYFCSTFMLKYAKNHVEKAAKVFCYPIQDWTFQISFLENDQQKTGAFFPNLHIKTLIDMLEHWN